MLGAVCVLSVYLASVQEGSFMYRELYCREVMIQSAGTGAPRELCVWKHAATSGASVFGPVSGSRSSAISLGFRGSSYLSPTGNEQNSQNQACEQAEPCVPVAQGQYNRALDFSHLQFSSSSSTFLNPVHISRPQPSEFPVLSEFPTFFINAMRCPYFIGAYFISYVSFLRWGTVSSISLDFSQPPKPDNHSFLMSL